MANGNQNNRNSMFFPTFIDPRFGTPFVPIPINPNRNRVPPFFPIMVPPPYPSPYPSAYPPLEMARIDHARGQALLTLMVNEDMFPSLEEETKRRNTVAKLKEIVMEWITNVAHHNGASDELMSSVSATVITFGSYGLGVHNSESDIDALCVGPGFATLEDDFFSVLRDMLVSRPEVSDVKCIKNAKVPLIRFKFDGISIDLPYAQLNVNSVPENVDIFHPYFLHNIDETSRRSISGVHLNKCIIRFVPNIETFQLLLRGIKLWAKKRGVYGNLFGFFGGVHLAILAAYICQRYPNVTLTILMSKFYKTFAFWDWSIPVSLQDGLPQRNVIADTRSLMPIRLPCRMNEYCHSNATQSNVLKISQEFIRGHNLCQDLIKPDFDWVCLFESFSYAMRYTRFLKIFLSATEQDELGEWAGWIKSRFRNLLIKLEGIQCFCDPNPTEYVEINVLNPNVAFYWGLQTTHNSYIEIGHVRDYFHRCIGNNYRGPIGRITMSIVRPSQFPKDSQYDGESNVGT